MRSIIIFLLLLAHSPAYAKSFGDYEGAIYLRNYDGDTVTFNLPGHRPRNVAAGLDDLLAHLAQKLLEHGLRFLAPRQEIVDMRDAKVPLRGKMGTGWDVAYAALFLASDEANFITGVALPVDGGACVQTG